MFFEKLQCLVHDDNLIQLTDEIARVSHTKMPAASTMLFRALFECALRYKIKKGRHLAQLTANNGERDPGLSELLKFAANKTNGVFGEIRICDVLSSQTTRDAKDYLDQVCHNHWRNADPTQLVSYANNLRNVISYILEGN